HPRASFLMHTGYLPSAAVKFPTLGSIVAKEIGDSASDLPGFVRIAGQGPGAGAATTGAGILGVDYDPLTMAAGRPPDNTGLPTSEQRFARRLIETGVTFVEVAMGGWDTHLDNFNKTRNQCNELDQPFAALLADLKERGLLDNTLVVWTGEFGRTPRINPNSGRDHFPRAFTSVLAGGGVRGGQVIGSTDAGGEAIQERPVSVNDLLRTACYSLSIDADKQNMSSIGRPIK